MAIISLPSAQNAKTIEDVINVVEMLRKEMEFALTSLDVDNMNKTYVSLVESGNTATGYYRKFSDGTMECYYTSTQQTDTVSWGVTTISGINYYYTNNFATWVFPKPFLSGSIVNVMASGDIGTAYPETHTAWHSDHTQCRVESGTFGYDPRTNPVIMRVSYFARGVWK
jgi:hypothetical protein